MWAISLPAARQFFQIHTHTYIVIIQTTLLNEWVCLLQERMYFMKYGTNI